jgi:VIT1/CCC1 family predicted Fe2+/Mn2+ transporter
MREDRGPVIFGAADGIITGLGILAGLAVAGEPRAVIWRAALAAGTAAFTGMTSGQYLSASDRKWRPALTCGAATFGGTVIPALPYLAAAGTAALIPALALVCAAAAVVSWLRPETGARAILETYGVLAIAAGLSAVTALI